MLVCCKSVVLCSFSEEQRQETTEREQLLLEVVVELKLCSVGVERAVTTLSTHSNSHSTLEQTSDVVL